MRHAAAAYLNASYGVYNWSTAQIVSAVNAALADGETESLKDDLDEWNNQGCFVDQHGNPKELEYED